MAGILNVKRSESKALQSSLLVGAFTPCLLESGAEAFSVANVMASNNRQINFSFMIQVLAGWNAKDDTKQRQ